MGARFSRIENAARLEAARQALQQYRDEAATRQPRVGTGTPRQLDAICYTQPFIVGVATTEVVATKAYNDGYTTLSPIINRSSIAAVSNALGTNTPRNIPKFRAARVIWSRAASRSISTPLSKFTNRQYLKYNNLDRFSCPFGSTVDTDDMIDSFLDVKAEILSETGFEISRVALQREQVGIESV